MLNQKQLNQAIDVVNGGGIIAYPTESVYGLGCHPFNETAVNKLLSLKNRRVDQGLILIASHIGQILPLIKPIEANDLARALKTWPGHHTWIFPKTALVPNWISGKHDTIAIRVSTHPVVIQLCNKLNSAFVSTSANISKQGNLESIKKIKSVFGDKIGLYINAPTGNETSPSTIHDAHTNTIIR